MSTLTAPYPAELMRIARKVVRVDAPEETLGDLKTFLAHLMVYGSTADAEVAQRYIPLEEFRKVLNDAPAGVFTAEALGQMAQGIWIGGSAIAAEAVSRWFSGSRSGFFLW